MFVFSNKHFKLCTTHIFAKSPAHVRLERLCDARVEGADDAEEHGPQRERAVVEQLLVPVQEIFLLVVEEQLLSCADVLMENDAFVYRNLAAALWCLYKPGRHFHEVASDLGSVG